jgi:hypothetical protein
MNTPPAVRHIYVNTLYTDIVWALFVLNMPSPFLPSGLFQRHLTDLHHFLICAHSRFNALWLAAFYHRKACHFHYLLWEYRFDLSLFDLRPLFQEKATRS